MENISTVLFILAGICFVAYTGVESFSDPLSNECDIKEGEHAFLIAAFWFATLSGSLWLLNEILTAHSIPLVRLITT